MASRILPIKIHDLDPEDKTLLENELGGVLRSIEFIYKSAGVNRPLRANEDHPQDNLIKPTIVIRSIRSQMQLKRLLLHLKNNANTPKRSQNKTLKQNLHIKI